MVAGGYISSEVGWLLSLSEDDNEQRTYFTVEIRDFSETERDHRRWLARIGGESRGREREQYKGDGGLW